MHAENGAVSDSSIVFVIGCWALETCLALGHIVIKVRFGPQSVIFQLNTILPHSAVQRFLLGRCISNLGSTSTPCSDHVDDSFYEIPAVVTWYNLSSLDETVILVRFITLLDGKQMQIQ